MRNKKGIVRIIEAIIAILIIAGVVLTLAVNRRVGGEKDLSETLPPLLEEIAKNAELREEIIVWETGAETELTVFLAERIKNPNLNYTIKICEPDKVCALERYPEDAKGDIFAAERIISAAAALRREEFSPKKIKLFLWRIK